MTDDDLLKERLGGEPPVDLPTPPEQVVEQPEEPREESKLARFLRRALRWITGIAVVFGLGVAAAYVLQIGPRARNQAALAEELAAIEEQRDELTMQVEELEGVRAENEQLAAELRQAQAQLILLDILVDVTTAQLALAQEDSIAARVALEETSAKLEELADASGSESIVVLQERLELVVDEVQSDAFAAQRDLEVLANALLSLERDLFNR